MDLAPCESPQDYVYNSVTGKSYKSVNESHSFPAANATCATDGATLIEHRNAAEHQVLKEMFGKCAFGQGHRGGLIAKEWDLQKCQHNQLSL